MPPEGLWRTYCKRACVDRSRFDNYFDGADEGFGVLLGGYVRFAEPIAIEELRERFQFFRHNPIGTSGAR